MDENNYNQNDYEGSNNLDAMHTVANELTQMYGETNEFSSPYGGMNGMGNGIPSLTPEEPTEKKNGKGPIILLIAIILVIVGVTTFAFSTKKSEAEKFVDMLANEYMLGMTPEISELSTKDGKVTTEVTVNPSKFETLMETEIPIERVALVSEVNMAGKDFSGKAYLDIENTELVTVKYAKTGDLLGVTVADLMNEYIVIKNENLKEFARKFGATEEEIKQIPDKLTVEEFEKMTEVNNVNVKAYEEILPKYKKTLTKQLDGLLTSEKNQEIVINDKTFKTTKHTIGLTEKELYEVALELVKVAKNDKKLYNTLKEQDDGSLEIETFEEWKETLAEGITEIEELIVDADDEIKVIEVSAYTKGKNTMCIEVSIPEEEILVTISKLNESSVSHTKFSVNVEGKEAILNVKTIAESKNEYKGTLDVVVDLGGVNVSLDLCEYSIKYSKDAVIEKIDASKDYILNDKTEEEAMEKFESIGENFETYTMTLMEKLPDSVKSIVEGNMNLENDYDFDSDYDYDFDSDYDYDFDSDYDNTFSIDGSQVFILEESNRKYAKMKTGMTKSEIIAAVGNPDRENDSYFGGNTQFLYWDDDYYSTYSAILEDGVVVSVERNINSSSYANIKLSAELGTEIEDLKSIISNVKDDMTLEEVENILGDKYFESERYDDGEVEYTWYDKKENYVIISFEDGKVWYIGSVYQSY